MNTARPLLAGVALGILLLSGCSSTRTAAGRIQKYPDRYATLPHSDQALVQQGRVREGMSLDAVYLAWGKPDFVEHGSRNGRRIETWYYSIQEPVFFPYAGWYPGFDLSYPGYAPYGFYSYGAGVAWNSVPAARVEFVDGSVSSWHLRTGGAVPLPARRD
jgi:uncharacterized protein YceK